MYGKRVLLNLVTVSLQTNKGPRWDPLARIAELLRAFKENLTSVKVRLPL